MMLANAKSDFPPEAYMKIADIIKKCPDVRKLVKRRFEELKHNLDQLGEIV